MRISLEEVYDFRDRMHEYSRSLISKKGHDYNREEQQGGNTLRNLFVCEDLKIVDRAERGILTRLSDKWMRMISLSVVDVDPKVEDESLIVTIADIHNYIDYLAIIYLKRRDQFIKGLLWLFSKTAPRVGVTLVAPAVTTMNEVSIDVCLTCFHNHNLNGCPIVDCNCFVAVRHNE